jgi:hypothetical protein
MMQTPSRVSVVSSIATGVGRGGEGDLQGICGGSWEDTNGGHIEEEKIIPTVDISPAQQRNKRDRFLAEEKAREITMYAFLLFAGSRNASSLSNSR